MQQLKKENENLKRCGNRLNEELVSLRQEFSFHIENGCRLLQCSEARTAEENNLISNEQQQQQMIETNVNSTVFVAVKEC